MIILYIRNSALRSSSLSVVYVVLDDIKNAVFKGTIYHPASGKQFSFTRVCEFLMSMENLFDTYGFPQHTHNLRAFRRVKSINQKKVSESNLTEVFTGMEKQMLNNENTGKATFVIKVLFRQNATWQGKIQWVEKNKTQSFRSDLEI